MEKIEMSSKRSKRYPMALKLLVAIIFVASCSLMPIVLQESDDSLWKNENQESEQLVKNIQATATLEAYSYAQSFSNVDRRLVFVHIPKTAGSTLEEVAHVQDKNITWGRCMFMDGTPGCSRVTDAKYRFGQPRKNLAPYWHVPVHYFPLENYNPYHADTFAVIRHPVDRAVSEYHYRCTRGWEQRPARKRQCKNMSSFILNAANPKEAKNFVFPREGFHWISQSDFIVGPFETRTVDYILQMEEMSPYFEKLVTAFGLPHLYWPTARKNAAPSLHSNRTEAAELPGNLGTAICKFPYVVDDLLLWKNSTPGRDLFPKAKYGHLCKS
jgi:hypothetical protein